MGPFERLGRTRRTDCLCLYGLFCSLRQALAIYSCGYRRQQRTRIAHSYFPFCYPTPLPSTFTDVGVDLGEIRFLLGV